MSIETDPTAIFRQAIIHGAVLLPQYLPNPETDILLGGNLSLDYLSHNAPRYGQLVLGLADVLGDPLINPSLVELGPNPDSEACFHRDSEGSWGISLLMPVLGQKASFYFSEVAQAYPHDTEQSRMVEYGVGDVIVLRQRLSLCSKTTMTRAHFSQIYHHGVCSVERKLATCDLVKHNEEVYLEEELYDEVAGFGGEGSAVDELG